MKLSQLGFIKKAETVSNKEVSGKDYFIYPGKAIVGDKKYFATVKDKSGYTYGADTDKAKLIKKEFTDKNLVVKPESTVYTDTTHVQSFRGKQRFVRHIVDDNIIKKKITTIKKDTPSITTAPINKKDAKEIKDIRHEYAGEKQRGYIPPPPTFWQKAKKEVGSWFKKESTFKGAKVYKDPIKVETKKRFLREDKKVEVVKPEVALSMKNTGFDKIRKDKKFNIEYASTDTLKTNNPNNYTVTHRYLGKNQIDLPVSFKYKEKVKSGGGKHSQNIVGGSYDLTKNINEITSKPSSEKSYYQRAKSYFGF